MSTSEIADNKWELEASRAPIFTPGGIAQLGLIVGFAAVFGYIFVFSIVAVTTPKQDNSLGEMYKSIKPGEDPGAN